MVRFIKSVPNLLGRFVLKIYRLFCFIILIFFAAGSMFAEAGAVDDLLKVPLGDGGLNPGMTKAQVVQRYGDPDIKSLAESKEWKEPREEWFYRATFDALPVNAGYLSEDLYLYFDGDNLTNISKKPLAGGNEDMFETDQ